MASPGPPSGVKKRLPGITRSDVLLVRDSGRPLREFLQSHGNLKTDEITFFATLLTRSSQNVTGLHWKCIPPSPPNQRLPGGLASEKNRCSDAANKFRR
jgi:hypothetical protein